MKLLIAIVLALLFIQSYFYNTLSRKNTAIHKEHADAILAIQYHEEKNSEMIKQVQILKNQHAKIDATLSEQKIAYSEIKTKNEELVHSINQLKQSINAQKIFIQQKDNEILVLKNELLKYYSE